MDPDATNCFLQFALRAIGCGSRVRFGILPPQE
jgi:hypothetical protein